MTHIRHIVFLIHPFCHADVADDGPRAGHARRERKCAALWAERTSALPNDATLVILPSRDRRHEPTRSFIAQSQQALGRRCLVVRPDFPPLRKAWPAVTTAVQARVFAAAALAFEGQGQEWSAEELHHELHMQVCVEKLRAQLADNGLVFEPTTVSAEVWGESFDGCVTKYSLELRERLGLSRPIDIDFDMTVPDAGFLLEARPIECRLLTQDLRIHLLETHDRLYALYTATRHRLHDPPQWVCLDLDPGEAIVRSKQGVQLWPRVANDGATDRPTPYNPVYTDAGHVVLPISAGMVFCPAKAPAYVTVARGTDPAAFFAARHRQARPGG